MTRWLNSSANALAWPERAAIIRAIALGIALTIASPASVARDAPDPVLRELLREAIEDNHSFPDRFEAEVWLKDMAARLGDQVPDPAERVRILEQAHREATRAELPPEMVLAVIDIESAFDAYAVSVAGAQGLMQVMPFWLDEIGHPDDRLVNIETNLRMGCTILKYYYDMENGDWIRALGRYNGSLGKRDYPNRVIDRLRKKWFRI